MELIQDTSSPSSLSKNNISTVRSNMKFGQSPNFNTNYSEEESKFSTKEQTVTIVSHFGDSRNMLLSRENQEMDQQIKEMKKLGEEIRQLATCEDIVKFFETQYQVHGKDVFELADLIQSPHLKIKKYKQSLYFGEVQNDKRIGRGIMVYWNGRIYEGEWQNDLKFGKGYELYPNQNRYEGQFVNGKPEGTGTYVWSNSEIYDGQWLNGMKHGLGMWKGRRGDSYTGEWRFGKADGYGVHIWINGDRYEGQFKGCLKHGDGTEKFANGDVYQGQYINGRPEGLGEYNWKNGSVYKGQFKNGLRHGKGVWKKTKTGVSDRYEGEYVNDKKCGEGEFQWASGNVYKGHYFDDLRHGYGEMYWVDGSYYKGQWDRGIQSGEGELFIPGEGLKRGVFVNNVLTGNEIMMDDDQQNVHDAHDGFGDNFITINKENILAESSRKEDAELPSKSIHPKSITQDDDAQSQQQAPRESNRVSLSQKDYAHNYTHSSNNSSRCSRQQFELNKSLEQPHQFETPERQKSLVSERTQIPIPIRTFTKQRRRNLNQSYNVTQQDTNKIEIDQRYKQQISHILSQNKDQYQQFYLRHTTRLPNLPPKSKKSERYQSSDKQALKENQTQDKDIQVQIQDINQQIQESINGYSDPQQELSGHKRSISVQDKRYMTSTKQTQTQPPTQITSPTSAQNQVQKCKQIYSNNFIRFKKSDAAKPHIKNQPSNTTATKNELIETNYDNYQFPKLDAFKSKLRRSPSPVLHNSNQSPKQVLPLTKHEVILWNKYKIKLPQQTIKQLFNYADPATIEKIRSYIAPPVWKPAGILQSYTDFSPSRFSLKKAYNFNASNSNSNIKQNQKLL